MRYWTWNDKRAKMVRGTTKEKAVGAEKRKRSEKNESKRSTAAGSQSAF